MQLQTESIYFTFAWCIWVESWFIRHFFSGCLIVLFSVVGKVAHSIVIIFSAIPLIALIADVIMMFACGIATCLVYVIINGFALFVQRRSCCSYVSHHVCHFVMHAASFQRYEENNWRKQLVFSSATLLLATEGLVGDELLSSVFCLVDDFAQSHEIIKMKSIPVGFHDVGTFFWWNFV